MKSNTSILTIFVVGMICPLTSLAQIHLKADIQNMHLWRGVQVADGVVLTSDLSITDSKEHFRFGLWGGTNTKGSYKEFNHYASYTNGGFKLAFWDTYNFSDGASYNNKEYFNYKARSTGRFLDSNVSYRFGKKFPLLLYWSTILFGRDRDELNEANKYSSYCYVEYPVYLKNEWRVDMGVGGAFALNRKGSSSNFYGRETGIVNACLKVSRDLSVFNYKLPVSVYCMWNPMENRANMQLSVTLLSLSP